MERQSQQAPGEGFAGVYLRLGGNARFWGWGTPPLEGAERARGGTADVPHAPSTAPIPPAGRDTEKPAVQFVCDRHFIGLVVR
jgi:hypothetical protein